MAHIYLTFDFGTDEEKAQLARHRLDGWKQAFRLDKKLTYKFERPSAEGAEGTEPDSEASEATEKPAKKETGKVEKPGKGGKATKGEKVTPPTKGKKAQTEEPSEESKAAPSGPVKLLVRLAFSGHEKMTEERWVKRIPTEEPFAEASPETVKPSSAAFAEVEGKFEALE